MNEPPVALDYAAGEPPRDGGMARRVAAACGFATVGLLLCLPPLAILTSAIGTAAGVIAIVRSGGRAWVPWADTVSNAVLLSFIGYALRGWTARVLGL